MKKLSYFILLVAPFMRSLAEAAPVKSLATLATTSRGTAGPRLVRVGDTEVLLGTSDNKGATLAHLEAWEDGVLPLVFTKYVSQAQKAQLFEACAEWSKKVPVHCVEGSYKGRHLKVGSNSTGCWSLWGMGWHFLVLRRHMNLAKGCWRRDILLHELGHAFGLIHEHQRPDRDQFIEIHPENVSGGFLQLQTKVNFDHQAAILETPYDFNSIMHYDRRAFSKNGLDTIVPKRGYENFINSMGRATEISDGDVAALRNIYH